MKPIWRVLIPVLVLAVGGGLVFFFSSAGRDWRLARTSTADLLLNALGSPQEVGLQRTLAKRYTEEGKLADAIGVYSRLTAQVKDNPALWIEQARLLYVVGNFPEAAESVQHALQNDRSVEALALAGDIQAMLGDKAQAKQLYVEATQKQPNYEQALAGLALFDTEEHQFAASEARLQKVQNPKSSLFFLAQGFLEEQRGSLEKARASYKKSLEIDPNQIRTLLLNIALLIRDAHSPNDTQQVEAFLQRAERLAPASRSIPYYRGLLHLSLKQFEEAERAFNAALERDPNFTDALFQLSQAQVRQGKLKESEVTRQRFETVNDYQREINNLQIRIGRFPTDIALWKQMKGLAEAHQDASRLRLAEQRLQTLSH